MVDRTHVSVCETRLSDSRHPLVLFIYILERKGGEGRGREGKGGEGRGREGKGEEVYISDISG